MHVEGLGRSPPVLVPDLSDQLIAADDGTWVGGEAHQQVELLRRQGDRLLGEYDAACPPIDAEVAELDRGIGLVARRPARSAQDRADPCHELSKAEGLDDVVVGSEFEQDDAVDLLAAGGHDDDRHRAARPEFLTHHPALEIGEAEVEQDEIGWCGGERSRAGRGELDLEALASKSFGERAGDVRVVLDEQQPHDATMSPHRWAGADLNRIFAITWLGVGTGLRTVRVMNTAGPEPRRANRTKVITVASIAGVAVAAAIAIAANIGILDAADGAQVGTLSAAGAPADTQVVEVVLPATTTPATTTAPAGSPAAQEFTVDTAGTASVAVVDGALRLDGVAPAAGWTWSSAQSGPTALTVTFTDGNRTLDFIATAAADGTVTASVEEPVAAPAPVRPSGGDDDEEYEGGDDDD